MKPVPKQTIADRIEALEALDAAAEPLQRAAHALVPEPSRAKDVLSGTWLGHPLHPLLTDVVVGAWTSAAILDLAGPRSARAASDRLVGTGIVAALPTAVTGLSDWADTRGGARRAGVVHAAGNVLALVLHALSWTARRRGNRGAGRALSLAGIGAAGASAWLGGHLAFAKGVGVNQTAFSSAPEEWTAVDGPAEVAEGTLAPASAGGVPLVLARRDGRLAALLDRCNHRGCPLHRGTLNEDGTITCSCHGSTFRLDGSLVSGPATAPQPALETREAEGRIEVRARS